MIWPCSVTNPTGQAGLAVTGRDRVVATGARDVSKRCCSGPAPPGHELVLFSPQKRTAECPTFATWRLPLASRAIVKPGIVRLWIVRVTCSRAWRGPGTSRVTKEPIRLMTETWPCAPATGLTKKPTKCRSEPMPAGTCTTMSTLAYWRGPREAVGGTKVTLLPHCGSALVPMLTVPLSPSCTARWAIVTVTGLLPGLTTRMGIRTVVPLGAGVGSEGIDTARPRGEGDVAAMTVVGPAITIASPTTAVIAIRQPARVPAIDSALLPVVTAALNHGTRPVRRSSGSGCRSPCQ